MYAHKRWNKLNFDGGRIIKEFIEILLGIEILVEDYSSQYRNYHFI